MTRDDAAFPEGNDEVLSKGPCPKCPTEYGFVTYADGHGNCYSCGHRTKANSVTAGAKKPKAMPHVHAETAPGLLRPSDYPDAWTPPKNRMLTEKTIRRYGYFKAMFKGDPVGVSPYYDEAGAVVCQKVRLPNKEFIVLKADGAPDLGKCQLFGRPVWGDKNDKRVVVTEGEIDAMSCAQATEFEFPCVSGGLGAKGMLKHLKANYIWLDRFREIVLWFDDDQPGRDAVTECAPLFKVGKVKIARMP